MTKAITTKGQAVVKQEAPVETLLQLAIEKGVPVETLERLLAMKERIDAQEAKRSFDEAMAAFQAKCPVIKKTKKVPTKSGATAYAYAPLESIVQQVKEILQRHGFSYSVKTKTGEGNVEATCIVRHKGGHSEESSMEVPLGNKTQVMSDTQLYAAASTFAKRYAFCNAFGIMTGDEDNEVTLKQKENEQFRKATVQEAETKLRETKNLDELKKVWSDLPAAAKKDLANVKEAMKKSFNGEIPMEDIQV